MNVSLYRSALSLHVFIIILTILCRLKIAELKKRQIGDIGFINTNLIDATKVKYHAEDTKANLLRSLVINENKDIILFPYNFK